MVRLRETLQLVPSQGITAAQDRCAELMYTSRRAWQQWERGERKMHPAFWELANTKIQAEACKMGEES
ncbi:MAG: hypothetical protein IBX55_00445 [Methyloprofundus sp.]|nr:hypothetical protein [Methyloprofundus sp.]